MKNILLILFTFFSTAALSQSTGYLRYDTVRVQKIGGNSTLIIENATRNLDGAFLQNYSQGRTRFAHALDSVWLDGDSIRFRYGSETIAVLAGSAIDTISLSNRIDGKIGYASNGLSKSGDTVMLGGPLGTPASIWEKRVVDLNNNALYFIKNNTSNPIAGTPGSTPLYGEFIDSLNQNNPSEAQLPTAATSWARILRMTGNYSYGYKVGHAVTMSYEFGDTARVISNGGDFGGALYNKLSFGYLPSFTTGRSAIQGGVVSFESAYAGLSIIEFASSNANRHIKYNGWVAAHNAVLRMTNFPDTIENFIFYNAHSYKEASAKVLKSYGLYMNGVPSDSAWTVYSPHVANRFYQSGKAVFGLGGFSSDYQLKVTNNTQLDSLTTASRLAQSDTTGYDVVLRDRTTGLHKHIRADQLGVGGGGSTPGIDDVLAQGQALTADRTIDIGSHSLQINGSDTRFSEFRQNGFYGLGMQDPITFNDASTSMYMNDSTSHIAFQATNLNTGSGQANLSLTAKYGESRLLMEADSVVVRPAKMKIVTIADSADYYITLQPKDQSVDYKAIAYTHWPTGGGGGGGGAWGSITGTLADQTDLQSALDGKVGLSGNETIADTKTFSGNIILSGGIRTNSTSTSSNLAVQSSAALSSASVSELLFGGASTINYRALMRGSGTTGASANASIANLILGSVAVTEAASGTHAINANLAIKGQVINNGSGATTDAATLYIEGPPTGTATITNPVNSLWVGSGKSLFTDGLRIGTAANQTMGTATLSSGTVTVNTTAVTADSKIFVSVDTPGGTQGFLSAPSGSITPATSFVINSTSVSETSTVNWWIIN